LRVTNTNNGKEVIVKVTDRGPFSRRRVIDLSYRAAKELGILAQGVAMVKVEIYQDANGIPYRPSDELQDFEIAEAGYSFIGEWKNAKTEIPIKTKASKKKEASKQKAAKSNENTRSSTSTKPQKKEGNMWSDVFDKLKNWKEDIFN